MKLFSQIFISFSASGTILKSLSPDVSFAIQRKTNFGRPSIVVRGCAEVPVVAKARIIRLEHMIPL